jgi:hypothetical protein
VSYDASDPAQIKKAEQEYEDREKDLDWILSEPRGRRFLYDLIYGVCHVDNLSHVPGDTNTTAFNEGGRAIGTALQSKIRERSLTKYFLMLKENHNV